MFKNQVMPYFQIIEKFIRENFSQILSYAVLIVAVIMTFSLQNRIVGWEPGYDDLQPKHHGWVTSQGLAIISNATLENNFVGFAVEYKDDQNVVHYDYFDRYPVFFSAIFNRVLALRPKLSDQVYLAKQVMNLIFLCTFIVAFLIIDKLIKNKPLSLAVVLLAFSNPFLLFYKDMVHFDQPALFGFLLLIYTIALYKLDGLKIPLYISTFVAIALGRGYASYAILILWLVFEAFMILRSKDLDWGQKLKSVVKHPSFFLLVLGIVWGASLLSYNIFVEARKRDIPLSQTSILFSAQKRLSLNPEFNEDNVDIINWQGYAVSEINRIIQWTFPFTKVNLEIFGNTLLLGGMFFAMGLIVRRQSAERRMIYLLLMLSGFAWLIPLRNLAAFHDYTTMYFIGVPLVFFLSVFMLLNPSKETTHYLVVMGLIIYLLALTQVRDLHESLAGNASQYTYDFTRIVEKIDGKGNNVFLADIIPHGPYAAEFYLSGQYISPEGLADYVIARDKKYLPDNLTPENSVMFLFKK
jgi:hypothetical protein